MSCWCAGEGEAMRINSQKKNESVVVVIVVVGERRRIHEEFTVR